MASKAISSPLIRHVAKRGYAQAMPAIKETNIQYVVLPSNTFVAALDNGSPVTRVSIAFRAGSRYEPATEQGISHVLRSSAGLSTGKASSFITTRKLAQLGATFSASGDREFIYYTLETTQDNLEPALECLNNIVSNQEFRPWELSDNAVRLKYETAALPPQVRAVDLLHKAAFRRGLGNSLFISPKRVGSVSSESLMHFASTTLTPARCSIAVIGESKERAILIAQSLKLPSVGDESAAEATQYFGGDQRKEMGGPLAHVVLAAQGASAGSPQALALAVAAKALGHGPVTKWGSDNSCLAKAIGNIGPFAAAGFNVSYSDSGLFGVVLSVPKDEANAAVKGVAGLLKNLSLTSAAIKAGKNQLKLQILTETEMGTSLAELLAAQGLYTGNAKTPNQLAETIEKLSENEINQALSTVTASKLSIGAAGNLAFVPYTDEL